jgi:hypothetical protein
MKFSFARTAMALAATLTLASCGGGGKATYPINITVANVLYPGLVLSTNGTDYTVNPPAKAGDSVSFVFPKELEYGDVYEVIPKGQSATSAGAQPKHQTCQPVTAYPNGFQIKGTAGQLARIQINYTCAINVYVLTGMVKGLTTTGLVLTNGSNSTVGVAPATDATTLKPTGADVPFTLASVPYGSTYSVAIPTQPAGQTCNVTSGGNGATPGAGLMDDAAEAAGGVGNIVITCVNNT